MMYHISRENSWNVGDVLVCGEKENEFWRICKNYSRTVSVDGKEMSVFQMFKQVSNFEVTQRLFPPLTWASVHKKQIGGI